MRLVVWCVLAVSLLFASCAGPAGSVKQSQLDSLLVVKALEVPVFPEKEYNRIMNLTYNQMDSGQVVSVITINFVNANLNEWIKDARVLFHGNNEQSNQSEELGYENVDGTALVFNVNRSFPKSVHHFSVELKVKKSIALTDLLAAEQVTLNLANGTSIHQSFKNEPLDWRVGRVVRAAGQDNCDTYRIPGLVTTNAGSLIAVYDNRYNNSKDLQEDIDIGMSRSTDGGQTWEPMKVILDMGQWGGLPEELNGAGDPCVLYDHHTHTIWVAALWLHGSAPDKMAWWDSKPGMQPGETGQVMLVKSTDDGMTWSEPINITEQIKQPDWQLLLQGPGRGITLEDGTLVFPAQFKADIGQKAIDGGQYTCHSTIIYSKDQGQTWHIGTGAKANTTEAQVAALSDGTLMLNMRDDRNRKDKSETNGRAVATTSDLGQTWAVHPTSNSVLPESNCMASLISTQVKINGQNKHILFFSNPNNKLQRTNMTIKASLDDGMTWPYALELNETAGFGYSCLTLVDDDHIGILYEGVKEIYFQKIPVDQILIK